MHDSTVEYNLTCAEPMPLPKLLVKAIKACLLTEGVLAVAYNNHIFMILRPVRGRMICDSHSCAHPHAFTKASGTFASVRWAKLVSSSKEFDRCTLQRFPIAYNNPIYNSCDMKLREKMNLFNQGVAF